MGAIAVIFRRLLAGFRGLGRVRHLIFRVVVRRRGMVRGRVSEIAGTKPILC